MSAEICPDCGHSECGRVRSAAVWKSVERIQCYERTVARLRAELAVARRERDYLLQFADPKEVAQMRRELAAEWEWQGAQGQPAKCSHERRIRGANIPRRYGSFRSQVCLDCGAFRAMTHHDEPHGKWLPAEQYAAEIVNEDEEDEVAQEQPAAAPERISDTEPAAPAPSWLCHRCMKRYANQSEFDYHECARSHAPAPELPRKVEPGTNLNPGGRYRITAISGHSPVGSAHHSVGCELECSEGAECALQPKWLDAGVLGSAWAAWGEMHRGCTYVTGLELIADAPEAGK